MADEPEKTGAPCDVGAAPAPRGRDFIAENLRALFRNAQSEPLPPSLKVLLDRLACEDGA